MTSCKNIKNFNFSQTKAHGLQINSPQLFFHTQRLNLAYLHGIAINCFGSLTRRRIRKRCRQILNRIRTGAVNAGGGTVSAKHSRECWLFTTKIRITRLRFAITPMGGVQYAKLCSHYNMRRNATCLWSRKLLGRWFQSQPGNLSLHRI
jgi:hypothetical protein